MSNSKSASLAHRLLTRWVLIVLFLAILITTGWETWGTRNRVPRGLFIGDVALSGLTWGDAGRAIADYVDRQKQRKLVMVGDNATCSATLDTLGASLNRSNTEVSLRQLAAPYRGIRGWFKSSVLLRPTLDFEPVKFADWLGACESRALKHHPTEGRLVPKEVEFLVQPSRAGQIVDRSKLMARIAEALSGTDDAAIALAVVEQPELPTRAELERMRLVSVEVVSKPVSMRAEQSHLTLLRTDLAKLLTWQLQANGALDWRLSRPAFDQWLAPRRHRVEQRARDATFELAGHDKLLAVPEQKGNLIAVERLFISLESALREGKRQLEIPFEPSESPKRFVTDLEALNIHEPVGEFTTRHACCQPRVNNIHRIAELVNGTIVGPSETYSVNEHVGQRSLENGFVPAPSIEDGEMVDTVGGGVSQFATTFYNAILRAGYDVSERQAHTYWFDRYPMGHEATLSWPKPDIVFRNDTKSGLLILASYTERSVTVRLFGDREGRKVDISVSPRFDIVRPTIEYLPNAELEPEKERVKEGGCIGWSVWTMRTVRMKDGTLKQDKRKVIYKPRLRRVEVHPCKIPKGEPGHTGEKCPEPEVETNSEDAVPTSTAPAAQ